VRGSERAAVRPGVVRGARSVTENISENISAALCYAPHALYALPGCRRRDPPFDVPKGDPYLSMLLHSNLVR
jgi:hypothetical protein